MELQILEVSQVNAYIKGLFDGTRCWGRCAFRESSATIRYIPRGITILQ